MSSFLDYTGLSRLVSKIIDKFAKKDGTYPDMTVGNVSNVVPIEKLPTASSVTSGDTTHVPTADAVANYSNRIFVPGDVSKGNTLLFTVRFSGSTFGKGFVNFLVSLTYVNSSPCIISAEFGTTLNSTRGCFCYINGPEIGRTTLFYKQISATANNYQYEIWMCDRRDRAQQERRCQVTILGRDAIDITPGNTSVTSDVSGLTEFTYRQGIQYDTRSVIGSTNSQGTTPEWALLGSFIRLSTLPNAAWGSTTVLVEFESRVSQVGTASVLINFTASATDNKVTSTWIGNSIPLSESPSFFVKYNNYIWYLYAYQNRSNRYWANYKSVELTPNNNLLYSNDGAGYLDTAPSGVSQIPYEYNVPIFNSNTGVGSASIPVYVKQDGSIDACTPSNMTVGNANTASDYNTSSGTIRSALSNKMPINMFSSGYTGSQDVTVTDEGHYYTLASFTKGNWVRKTLILMSYSEHNCRSGMDVITVEMTGTQTTAKAEWLHFGSYGTGGGGYFKYKYKDYDGKIWVLVQYQTYSTRPVVICNQGWTVYTSTDAAPSSVLYSGATDFNMNNCVHTVNGKGSVSRPVYVSGSGSVEACNTSFLVNPGNIDLTTTPYSGYSVGYVLDVVNTGASMIYVTTGNGSTGVPVNGSRRFCKTESNKWTYVAQS